MYWCFLAFALLTSDPEFPFRVDIKVEDRALDQSIQEADITILSALTLDTLAVHLRTDTGGRLRTELALPVSQMFRSSYWIGAAYPNPIQNGSTVGINYVDFRGSGERPQVEWFDVRGRLVDPATGLSSGIYFYRLRYPDLVTKAQSVHLIHGGTFKVELHPLSSLSYDIVTDRSVSDITTDIIVVIEKEGYAAQEARFTLVWGEAHTWLIRLAVASANGQASKRAQVYSPNRRVVFDFSLKDEHREADCMYYRISVDGKPLILDSMLGLDLLGMPALRCNVSVTLLDWSSDAEIWEPAHGQRSSVHESSCICDADHSPDACFLCDSRTCAIAL